MAKAKTAKTVKKAPVAVKKKPAPKVLEVKPKPAAKPNSGKPVRPWSATRDEKFAKTEGEDA